MTDSIRHFIRTVTVFTFAVGVVVLAGGPTLAATLTVDDDHVQCPGATFATIQAAVDASSPGDTIKVCPGTYARVDIPAAKSDLLLQGSTASPSVATCLGTGPSDSTPTIVNGGAGALQDGFLVKADNITIQNFTVQNASGDSAGVNLSAATSGHLIRNNIIQNNTFGLHLNNRLASTATEPEAPPRGAHHVGILTVVDGNCFRNNNEPGSAAGNGIYSDQGTHRVDILRNTFTGHSNASIILVGAAHDDMDIRNNKILQDAPITLANLTDSGVITNVITDSVGSAIFFMGSVTTTEVSANSIDNCAFSGINVGTTFTGVPNTKNLIARNRVNNCGEWGIAIRDGSNQNMIEGNTLENNGRDGLFFENGDNNTAARNVLRKNDRDGLRVDANSTGNLFTRNSSSGNLVLNCHDVSVGARTAGTANTYAGGNAGPPSAPAGICPP